MDIAIAGPVLQRDAPLPACRLRGRAGVRRHLTDLGAGNRDRAIARKPMSPVVIAGAQRFFDQQAAKPAAIDEELAGDLASVIEFDRRDISVFAVKANIADAPFDAGDAARFGIFPQELRIKPRVEMIVVVECRLDLPPILNGMRELSRLRHRPRHREIIDRPGDAPREMLAHPEMIEGHEVELRAVLAERMKISLADPAPVDELDSQLVGAARFAHECRLVDPEPVVEEPDRRDRRLADADGADLFGFDDRDGAGAAKRI